MVPVRANGQLAFGHYVWNTETEAFTPHGITVLTLERDRIAEITSFVDPEHFASSPEPS
jgi:RNA polymerase sigma-70 factor (ECF subfamily)